MTTAGRRRFLVLVGPASAVLLVLATARCGLLGSPGGYSGGADDPEDAAAESADGRGGSKPDSEATADGSVSASIGTIAVLAGARDPTSPDDVPAWSADAWSGILDANGHVARWRIEKSAPLVGSFACAGLVADKWMVINDGFVGASRGTALQQTSWLPGIVGDWRASGAGGAPDGLAEATRAFFGARLAYVGGVRSQPVDGGTNTFLVNEVHVSVVDTVKNTLGSSTDTGAQLLHARARPAVVFEGGGVYVVGGRTAMGLTSSVEMAKVDAAAGTVAMFVDQPSLQVGGADHRPYLPSLAVGGGYLWVAGGRTTFAGAPTDVVLSAKIDPATGALGAFQSVTKLPMPLHDFAFVAFKGRLYVAGGVSATPRSDGVFSAPIGPGGTLGGWQADAKLPGARSDFVTLAY